MNHTEINTIKQLANYLRCDNSFLEDFLNGSITVLDSGNWQVTEFYNSKENKVSSSPVKILRFYIPKKNKMLGYRIVHKVLTDTLSNMLKGLNTNLSKLYNPPTCVHGFVTGRNIKTNAEAHLSKKYIISLDINSFFETITKEMVVNALIGLHFNQIIAEYIGRIVTIDGHLVQGYNTSPTVANMVYQKIDEELIQFCGQSISYTRYADDLYFSSNECPPDAIKIKSIIETHGFVLNPAKTKLMVRGENQYVTGLTVFDKKYPRLPKRIKRSLRLETYYINKFGPVSHACKQLGYDISDYTSSREIMQEINTYILSMNERLRGWIYFMNSIEPIVAQKLKKTIIK